MEIQGIKCVRNLCRKLIVRQKEILKGGDQKSKISSVAVQTPLRSGREAAEKRQRRKIFSYCVTFGMEERKGLIL